MKCIRLPQPHYSEARSITQCMQFAHYLLQNNEIDLTLRGASTVNEGGEASKWQTMIPNFCSNSPHCLTLIGISKTSRSFSTDYKEDHNS